MSGDDKVIVVSWEGLSDAQQKNDAVRAQMLSEVVFDVGVHFIGEGSFFEPRNWIKAIHSVVWNSVHEHDENMVDAHSLDQ